MIEVSCKSCLAKLRLPDEKAGARGRCPVCGGVVVVPRPAPQPEPQAELDFAPEEPPPRDLAAHPHIPQGPQAVAPAAAGAGKTCPSCGLHLPYNAKICVQCGIRVPSGRPLLTVRDVDRDVLEIDADRIIRKVSWLVPTGIFPVYSEAMGKSRPYVTWAIAALTIVLSVYAWTDSAFLVKCMLWAGDPNLPSRLFEAVSLGGLYHPYQYLTHMFLHAGIMHLAGNLVFLLVLGSRVNAKIGNIAMAPVYLLLGVAAAQSHIWASADEPVIPMLGASGAIMGLAGMYVILFPLQKVYMATWIRWGLFTGFRLTYKVFALRGILVVLFYIAFDVAYTVLKVKSGTAHWAHIGGMSAGAALAVLLLVTRILYCPGDLVSLALGRFAWPLLGTPASRQRLRG